MAQAGRDFSAELQAARVAQDWAAHERIWEERRHADVAADEEALREYLDTQDDQKLISHELAADRAWLDRAEYSPEAFDEMVRQDAESRT